MIWNDKIGFLDSIKLLGSKHNFWNVWGLNCKFEKFEDYFVISKTRGSFCSFKDMRGHSAISKTRRGHSAVL